MSGITSHSRCAARKALDGELLLGEPLQVLERAPVLHRRREVAWGCSRVVRRDGHAFRALGVWPAGTFPADDPVAEGPSAGYRSELGITGQNPL